MTIDLNKPQPEDRNSKVSFLTRALAFVHRVEDMLLAGILTATMLLAVWQILLRNLLGSGIVWGDVLVRILVLWIGMAGAMVATRQRKHISIDLVSRYLSETTQKRIDSLTALFAATVCSIAAYYCFTFVQDEFAFGDIAFGQVPVWVCQAILPIAFSIIAARYFILFLINVVQTLKAGR